MAYLNEIDKALPEAFKAVFGRHELSKLDALPASARRNVMLQRLAHPGLTSMMTAIKDQFQKAYGHEAVGRALNGASSKSIGQQCVKLVRFAAENPDELRKLQADAAKRTRPTPTPTPTPKPAAKTKEQLWDEYHKLPIDERNEFYKKHRSKLNS